MKISRATITVENVFDNLEINFMRHNGPTIHYLVGNNGAGKTHVLEILHASLTFQQLGRSGSADLELTINNDEIAAPCTGTCNASLKTRWTNATSRSSRGIEGVILTDVEKENLKKSVYSNVEINFSHKNISTVSAATADSDAPKEKSTDLDQIIPQLLVNLRQQDANLRSDWMRDNSGSTATIPQQIPGEKLGRFINAYNEVFMGGKIFDRIAEESGAYKIYFADSNGNQVELKDLSSGEKQIIYRLGFILKNLETIDGGSIFIDEPEISLHPIWQLRFKNLLKSTFEGVQVQIFIATHSPYIFGSIDDSIEECIKLNRSTNTSEKIIFPSTSMPRSPSMNLVNFLAYDIPSQELHIELYNALQIISGARSINEMDDWFESQGLIKSNRALSGLAHFNKNDGTPSTRNSDETRPNWIRNKIHHPDLNDRRDFNEHDLEESIKEMLVLL